jgi:transcriptional regulator with XRE-family HTH domain
MSKLTLGSYLKQGRLQAGLSQADVARHLGLQSAQSVSDWERGRGSALPLKSLKALIPLYRLDENVVFDLLLEYQFARLEAKLKQRFFKGES